MTVADVVVDCAGAAMGGAANFLGELDRYVKGAPPEEVRIIGRGETLSPKWLLRREFICESSAPRVALNNVCFGRRGGARTVLLRNALHFADNAELARLGFRLSRAMHLQTKVVRQSAGWADRVVVPCTTMAERVLRYLPELTSRIEVRGHPVSPRPWAGAVPTERIILVPVLNAAYKNLDRHVERLLIATEGLDSTIALTGSRSEYGQLVRNHSRIKFLGRLTTAETDIQWSRARAVYFPTVLESFGYPLAQARVNGRRVIAQDTRQSREIAGRTLAGYVDSDLDSLTSAARIALDEVIPMEPNAFNPESYFTWLLTGDR